jgi:signal transduction histidine kinase
VAWWWLSTSNRRRQWLVITGGVLLGVATIIQSVLILGRGFEDPDAVGAEAAFLGRCVASLTIAGGLVWSGFYLRYVRRAVARVVVRFDDEARTGSLESALARATRDPSLEVVYWLPAMGRYSDSDGRPVREPSSPVRMVSTPVVRNGTPVAVITHSSDPIELERVLGSDLRLALDNERLRAELLAQLTELQESRARIVAAGDERRRQLERNLHDGAQQSLLGLTYDLRRVRAAALTNDQKDLVALCDHAVHEVGQAFAELRDLAHGIFPAVLSHAGLAEAITSVAETAPIPVEVDCTLTERLSPHVETAAYVVVADGIEAVWQSGATSATVTIARRQAQAVVEVRPDRSNHLPDMVHLADRVGAVGGTMSTDKGGLRAEIPCAS